MHHHLSRLLKHRLLLPSTSISSSAAAFSTSKRPATVRRPKKPPPEDPKKKVGFETIVAMKLAWPKEKHPSELPRPPTVPFQARVANAVRLIGTVGAPVQLQQMPDGRFSAVSVLSQDQRADLPKFWIPIIFQDDLAHVAASHLQENDVISVSGQVTGIVPPFKVHESPNIQVLAQSMSFVDSKAVETDVMVDEEEGFNEIAEAEKKVDQTKVSPKSSLGTDSGFKNKQDKLNTLWNDFLTSPQDWNDYRAKKKDRSIHAKYPDFKHKISKEALWLNTAPMSVLQKLDDVEVDSSAAKENNPLVGSMGNGTGETWMKLKTSKKNEADLWQNLVTNPQNWWDNRSNKKSAKSPDFKHKETGEVLWIGSGTPGWARDALSEMKASSEEARKPETLVS